VNTGHAAPDPKPIGPDFAAGFMDHVRTIYDKFVSSDGLAVDYASLSDSDELEDCRIFMQQLAGFDPAWLEESQHLLAFWINLYNFQVVLNVGRLGISKQVQDPGGFFDRVSCRTGGFSWSLNDIEYGILRGNARRSFRIWRQLRRWDQRRRLVLDPPEPRVCFALVPAACSGPPLRFFDSASIQAQLHQAAVDFISHGGVVIDRERDTISLSHLFRAYSRDFGGGQGVIRFIAEHLESPDDATFILTKIGKISVKYQDFDWSLNGTV